MKIRWIAIFLVLAMAASMLVGCNSGKNEKTTTTKAPVTTPEDTVPENLLLLASNGETQYRIVYPVGVTWAQTYAESLAATIEAATGVAIPVVHDSEKGAGEYEIRVGNVKGARMEVLEVYKNFGKIGDMDYAIKVIGNTVYLYATAMQGLASAVEYFGEKALAFGETPPYAGVDKNYVVIYNKEDTPTVSMTKTDDTHYVEFSIGAGTLGEVFCRLSYTGNGGWRIQTKNRASDAFDDFGAAQRLAYSLDEEDPSQLYPITVTTDGNVTTVREENGSYVTINTDLFELNFYGKDGSVPASTVTDIYANAGGSYIKGVLLDDEAVFGTGERFNTSNQRGKKLELVSKDIWSASNACYVAIPLLCLSRGSGIFLNRYERIELNLGATRGAENEWTATIQQANLDCYIFATAQISDVIYGYSDLTGFAEQPEEWSYGMLLCRFNPDLSQKWSANMTWNETVFGSSADGTTTADGRGIGVYDAIAKMEAYDLPWTGIIAEPWARYTTATYKDLKELCDYVHSLGKKFMLYIGVGGSYNASDKLNYFVSQTMPNGNLKYALPDTQDLESGNPDNSGTTRYYLDITNPDAVEWFFDVLWDELANEIGVDGCKIDFCELMPETYELNYYDDAMETAGSHHWYPTAFCAKFWEMISSKPDSGMCYIRGGGIGLQRSPYVWAGDQRREFESLSFQLTSVLSSGLSGLPFISYDMSGYEYMGGRAWQEKAQTNSFTTDPGRSLAYESQVFLRGLQFTAFTICMQTHGTVRWVYEFAEDGDIAYELVNGVYTPKTDANGNIQYLPLYQRDAETGAILKDKNGNALVVKNELGQTVYATPGTYAYVVDVYRAYVKLHELLTPYITEYSEIACTTGMPLMRHMILHWQSDANVYDIDDEYMFGDAFLVAPVLDETYSRDIYLPEGVWEDLNTGDTYTVGAEGLWLRDYAASITTLPVFYNVNTTSETAPDLIAGIYEIFAYIDEIESGIPSYLQGVLQ